MYGRLVTAVAIASVLAACNPSTSNPPASNPPASIAATSVATQPTQTIDPELGPQPTPPYSSGAIGIGTLRIASPKPQVARFWVTCEWSTTERVQWLYTGGGTAGFPGDPISLFGETVSLYVSNLLDGDGDPHSLDLSRDGNVAPYRIDPAEAPVLERAPDWTSGSVTFERFRLDPDAWHIGPLPTPRESYERPLGDDPTATVLAGSFEWTCGPRPRGVPTPGPAETPGPSTTAVELPRAKLTASGESRLGVLGCGATWGTGGEVGVGASCGGPGVPVPPYALEMPSVVHVRDGQNLAFSLPTGYHFESWTYEYVDQVTAELYRGAEPTGVVLAARAKSTTADTATVEPPRAGDWMIRFTFNATNGDIVVHGMPAYYRVVVE